MFPIWHGMLTESRFRHSVGLSVLAILLSTTVVAGGQDASKWTRGFSSSELQSITSACYEAFLSGAASFSICLERGANGLRRSRQSTTVSASSANPEGTPREANPTGGDRDSSSARLVVAPSGQADPVNVQPVATRPSVASGQNIPRRHSNNDAQVFWISVVSAVCLAVGVRLLHERRASRDNAAPRRAHVDQHTRVPPPPSQSHTYRPRSAESNLRLTFTPQHAAPEAVERGAAYASDVRDAVTGQALQSSRGLFRCVRCQASYHRASVDFVRAENHGRCVACGSPLITSVSNSVTKPAERDDEATLATLADYRSNVGHVVIFEGRCVHVLTSSLGPDYAVMFENATWSRGFKLVVPGTAVPHIGGPEFILALAGKRIRVRGQIVRDPSFGYQILTTDRAMILGVWP